MLSGDTTPPTVVRLYARLSRSTNESTSIARQIEDGIAYAERRWPGVPVVVYTDDGVSGAKSPMERKGLMSLFSEWQDGDALLVSKMDRLIRSLFGFLDVLRAAGNTKSIVAIHDNFDLTTPTGRMQAAILATVAEWERENTSTRVLNMRRHLHKVGRWVGGRAPYGLKPAPHPSGAGKMLVRDHAAADVIREMAIRIVAGEAMTTIAADLQKRGVPSPRVHNSGKKKPVAAAWSSRAVRMIMESPTIVGHQIDPLTGRLIRQEGGLPAQVWEPILTEEEQALVLESLSPPTPRKPAGTKHWLYAVMRCSECAGNLKRSKAGTWQPDVPIVRCLGTLKAKHRQVSARLTPLADLVSETVRERIGPLRAMERVYTPGSQAGGDIERLKQFLTELEEDRRAGIYKTPDAIARFRQQYSETADLIEELEATPSVEPGWTVIDTGERLADRWDAWTDKERGEWLREIGATVTVMPPPTPRERVPLADRCVIHLGALEDAYEALSDIAADEMIDA